MEDELWEPLQREAERVGSDRSTVLREFAQWFTRQPGARLPQRPPPLDEEE